MAQEKVLYESGIFQVKLTVFAPSEKSNTFKGFGDIIKRWHSVYALLEVLRESSSRGFEWYVSSKEVAVKNKFTWWFKPEGRVKKTRTERLQDAIHEAIKKADKLHRDNERRKEESEDVIRKTEGDVRGIEEARKITA